MTTWSYGQHRLSSLVQQCSHRPDLVMWRRHDANTAVRGCSDDADRTTKWSWLRAWALKVVIRRGMQRAIVALARRLAVVMHRMWSDGTEFRWAKDARTT